METQTHKDAVAIMQNSEIFSRGYCIGVVATLKDADDRDVFYTAGNA